MAHGPGFPLVSFLPAAKKDTASIPCAAVKRHPCRFTAMSFCGAKTHKSSPPASLPARPKGPKRQIFWINFYLEKRCLAPEFYR
jgi:hypothetical protein